MQVTEKNTVGTGATPVDLNTRYTYDPLDRLLTVKDAKNSPATTSRGTA